VSVATRRPSASSADPPLTARNASSDSTFVVPYQIENTWQSRNNIGRPVSST
jgi:hypothetical protein